MRIIRAVRHLPELLILIARDLANLAGYIGRILVRLNALESPKPVGPTLGTVLGHATRLEAQERRLNHIEQFDLAVTRMIAVENAKKVTCLADVLGYEFEITEGESFLAKKPKKARR